MHFDIQAKDWDNDPKKTERAQIFAEEITNYLKPNKIWNALEFGSGTGLLSYQLKDDFETITLVDNSEGMINVLNEKIEKSGIKNFKPLLLNLLDDNLNIGKFNVILTLMTLHHILDLNKILTIFNSILKTDGYLCIADLVKEDGSFHNEHPGFDGHNGFDKNELSKFLTNSGFKVEYYNLCFEIEKELDNDTKAYPLFLMICKKQ
ncbi:MAG: methyltransferase domain-containing protein [Flavobacteriaceae bacterium]|nr:methyltransferase domain-containing protein [Flavobacteriaceae bacterium]